MHAPPARGINAGASAGMVSGGSWSPDGSPGRQGMWAIAAENKGMHIQFGDLVCPRIPFTKKGFPILKGIFRGKFITPNGKVLGLLKTTQGGDLSRLGATGTNNYNKIWGEKRVYSED